MMIEIEKKLIKGNLNFQWKVQQGSDTFKTNRKFPKYPILILTCMDPRIDVHRIFQLIPGDVLVLRNAGNVYTRDVMRSILIAICEFDIRYIIVLGHLDCGMTKIKLHELRNKLGINNTIPETREFFKPFIDELMNVSNQVQALRGCKDFSSDIEIVGMLYDVNSGYVFESEIIAKYGFIDNFKKDYLGIIEIEKKSQLEEFIDSIETKKISEKEEQTIVHKNNENVNLPTVEKINDEAENKMNIKDNLPSMEQPNHFQLNVPKIKIPRIYIPKVEITIPNIYRKKIKK